MKKILIFGGIIIGIFVLLGVLTNMSNSEKTEGNPYKKDELHPETIKQLDDPNYQNIILPDDLKQKLDDQESLTVYFYSPTCGYCKQTTPVLKPLADEMDVDLKMYNVLEFEETKKDYFIEGTPTLVHFKDGKEVDRIVGYQEEETFRQWLGQYYK